ncbi:MAG: hypothetical protein JO168_16010 [Solirubrobacterales bacterium]|nr:hypothetical protein [Solirubrobacterales bacterium]MBV9716835.1 hypothetical protein [Solirubrobacterales bacterium]
MNGDAQLLLMIAGVHVLALGCVAVLMIPALRDGPDSPPRSSDSGSDEGWGRGPRRPPRPPEPPRGGIPLPDAVPAGVRLRDHQRLADHRPRRERRPAREPERRPVRTPTP